MRTAPNLPPSLPAGRGGVKKCPGPTHGELLSEKSSYNFPGGGATTCQRGGFEGPKPSRKCGSSKMREKTTTAQTTHKGWPGYQSNLFRPIQDILTTWSDAVRPIVSSCIVAAEINGFQKNYRALCATY